MNVVLVSQWFPPEQAPIGHMVMELAAEMATRGWEVTVVTGFPNHPYGSVFPGFRKSVFREEWCGDVRVWRVYLATSKNRSIFNRLLTFATFTVFSSWAILRRARPDVIFSILQPLSVGLTMPLIARIKKSKLLFNIQDLHPDAQIRMGLVTNRMLIRVLKWIERYSYTHASGLVTVCDVFGRHCETVGARKDNIRTIPNWIDLAAIRPGNRDNAFRKELGCRSGESIILFAGTIGLASGAEVIIDAAGTLRCVSNLKFVLVGDGPLRKELQSRVADEELPNVIFSPFQPRERINEVQGMSDISIVTMMSGENWNSVPSKVLGYMAAGRPVIASVDRNSETARLIEKSDCGVVVDPADGGKLAAAIEELLRNRDQMKSCGENGRKYLEVHCSKQEITGQYIDFISSLASG